MSKIQKINGIFDFLALADNLKRAYRYSQCRTKKMKPDSAADHSWRLALMAMVFTKKLKLKINLERALKIAIVHDLSEAITGDIDYTLIARGMVKYRDKEKAECLALKKICRQLPIDIGREIETLWQDYQESRSVEAKFIKALDKLETMIYLIEADKLIYCYPEVIVSYADKAVRNFPALKNTLRLIKLKLKQLYRRERIPWRKEYESF